MRRLFISHHPYRNEMVICLYRVPVGCGAWRMWFLKSTEVLVNRNFSWISVRTQKTSLECIIHVWKENGGAYENKASESHVFITLYVLWLELLLTVLFTVNSFVISIIWVNGSKIGRGVKTSYFYWKNRCLTNQTRAERMFIWQTCKHSN